MSQLHVDSNLDNFGHERMKSHLVSQAREILQSLQKTSTIALVRLPQGGGRRICQFLAEYLQKIGMNVIYNRIPEKHSIISKNTILICENFSDLTKQDKTAINDFYFENKHEIKSIFKFPSIVLDNPTSEEIEQTSMLQNIFAIKPYSREIANKYFEDLAAQYGVALTENQKNQIFYLSGGHRGLIKWLTLSNSTRLTDETALLKDTRLKLILEQIEQATEPLSHQAKMLLGLQNDSGEYLIPLYAKFRKQNTFGLQNNLSATSLLTLFEKNIDSLVSMQEIYQVLFNNSPFSYWKAYKVISRLKSRLPANYQLINVKGKGYVMRKQT